MIDETKLLEQPWKDPCKGFLIETFRVRPKSSIVDAAGSVGIVVDYGPYDLLCAFSAEQWAEVVAHVERQRAESRDDD